MHVELILNPEAPGYGDIEHDLREELQNLKGLTYEKETGPPPPKTLSPELQTLKYIFDHKDYIPVVIALIQLLRSIIERRKIKESSEQPPAVIVVNGKVLKYPSTPQAEKRFVDRLKRPKSNEAKASEKKRGGSRRLKRR